MALFGQGWDDPQSAAIMALAGGLLQGNAGAGLLAANQAYSDMGDRKMKRQLTAAQIADFSNQAKLRDIQAQQAQFDMDLIRSIRNRGNGGAPSQAPVVAAPAGLLSAPLATEPQAGGQPTLSAPMPRAGMSTQAPMSLGGDWLTSLMPQDLAALKLAKRDLTDVYKLATEPMELKPGLSMNRFTGQIMSIPYVSQDGKAVQVLPNGQGGFSMSVPEGAPEAYAGFTRAAEQAKNENTLLPQTIIDRNTKRPVGGTVGAYIRNTTPLPENQGNLPITPQVAAAIRDDALRNGITNPQVNINMQPDGQRNPQIGFARPGAQQEVPAAPQIQGPAEAKFNEKTAENDAGQINEALTKAQSAKLALPTLWQAQDLIKSGTFTGLGADAKLNIVRAFSAMGVPVPDSVANSQAFDATMAQIVGANLKAMVGSQNISNADVTFVTKMFGERGQEAKAIKYILDRAIDNNMRYINSYNDLLGKAEASGGGSMIGKVAPPTKPNGAPARISSDEEYNALPSGARFVGPDGKTRRKP